MHNILVGYYALLVDIGNSSDIHAVSSLHITIHLDQ